MSPYYTDDTVTLWHGDAAGTLAQIPDASVDCIVTSPPYFGLRDYGVDGQIGAEPTPADFVEALVTVFREARRVLADDGTLWLNLGDSYAAARGQGNVGGGLQGGPRPSFRADGAPVAATRAGIQYDRPNKSLLGIPWRVAFALQDDGWILRNDVIWAKPNAMPESVTDRLTTRHEHLFLFTKQRKYWFDRDAIAEPAQGRASGNHEATAAAYAAATGRAKNGGNPGSTMHTTAFETRSPGDVWTIPTQPFAAAHFATMPPELARRCVLAGCRPAGVVLDPFSGSGTTGLVATENGRRYVGIDLNEEYLELSLRTRLKQGVLDLGVAG